MEYLLWLYAQPYDADHPVVCFDERPCFLIGDRLEPLRPAPGKIAKEHYAYNKLGSCALLAAIEPLTGKRLAQVYARRTRSEYADFCQSILCHWSEAQTIRLVQDNLNTHSAGAFYANLPAEQAFALSRRFEFVYTPKSASWLNMIEIEFSALSRACLNRRIPTIEQLSSEVLAIVHEREEKQIKINWQFTIPTARNTLSKHYLRIHPDNAQYQST